MTARDSARVLVAALALGALAWPSLARAEARHFDITASRYQFDPALITVEEGDQVTITLKSADRSHGFEIKEYKVKTEIPEGGTPVTVEFVADKAGTFKFNCSKFCGMGHGRMKGQLVVKPKAQ